MTKKWNVRVSCMTASYAFTEYAQDENIAIENVKERVMPDMKNWNFSVSHIEGDDG